MESKTDDADDAEVRAQYPGLIVRIRDLEEIEPPPGWEERALARWRAARRKRRRLVLLAAAMVAAMLITEWIILISTLS
jgi:hypothetical protein